MAQAHNTADGPWRRAQRFELFVKGACVAPHDVVAPLGNSYGYYLHDDAYS